MIATFPELQALMGKELLEANKAHPLFHSLHEGYAVLLEELEESEAALKKVKKGGKSLWEAVRTDDLGTAKLYCEQLKTEALKLAGEALQTAAMSEKLLGFVTQAEPADQMNLLDDES